VLDATLDTGFFLPDFFTAWYRERPIQVAFALSIVVHATLICLVPGLRSRIEPPRVLNVEIASLPEPQAKPVGRARPLPPAVRNPELAPLPSQARPLEPQVMAPGPVVESAVIRKPDLAPPDAAQLAPAIMPREPRFESIAPEPREPQAPVEWKAEAAPAPEVLRRPEIAPMSPQRRPVEPRSVQRPLLSVESRILVQEPEREIALAARGEPTLPPVRAQPRPVPANVRQPEPSPMPRIEVPVQSQPIPVPQPQPAAPPPLTRVEPRPAPVTVRQPEPSPAPRIEAAVQSQAIPVPQLQPVVPPPIAKLEPRPQPPKPSPGAEPVPELPSTPAAKVGRQIPSPTAAPAVAPARRVPQPAMAPGAADLSPAPTAPPEPGIVHSTPVPSAPNIEPQERAKVAKPSAGPRAQPPQVAAVSPTPPVSTPGPIPTAPDPAKTRALKKAYSQQLSSKIQQYQKYPNAALRQRWEGTAEVLLTMTADGQVMHVELGKGTGRDVLDKEAVEMVRRASPLPQAPGELRGGELKITVPIVFRLKDS
jgi:periplasmic protein TonB